MSWAGVEATGQEGGRPGTQAVRYHPETQVMKFEEIALEARVMAANSKFVDDDTRVTLSLWRQDGEYRMTYVWHDMSDGIESEIYGQKKFYPNIIYLMSFYGGQLACGK
jgi:hypothetical protein